MENCLFFDFDGTLARQNGGWTSLMLDLLAEHGCESVTRDTLSPAMMHGFPWHEPERAHSDFFQGEPWWAHMNAHFARVLQGLGVDDSTAQSVAAMMRERFLAPERWSLYDDTLPALELAHEMDIPCAVLSNHVPELADVMELLGLTRHFVAVCNSAQIGYEKPNPAIFARALHDVGGVRRAVMIGDNITADVRGALAAGFAGAVLVRRENAEGYEPYSAGLVARSAWLRIASMRGPCSPVGAPEGCLTPGMHTKP